MARFFKGGGDGGDGQMHLFSALGGGEGVRLEEPEKIELGAESIRMVLPRKGTAGEGHTAPEVASEVRSAFSGEARKTGGGGGDGGPAMVIPGEKVTVGRAGSVMEGKPLPPTGIFRRPEPPSPPSEESEREEEEPAKTEGDGKGAVWEDEEEGIPWGMWVRAWLAGVDWNGKTIGVLAGAMVLVALLAVWSARGCGGSGGGGGEEIAAGNGTVEQQTVVEPVGGTPGAGEAVAIAEMGGGAAGTEPTGDAVGEAKPETVATAGGPAMEAWSVPGTKVEVRGGSQFVVFEEAVFESKDAISVAGMRAIRALAAKLKTLEGGAAVVVTGYTDDQPLTRPTAQFASNEDIAMARAVAAADHLKSFAKNKGLSFECVAGREAEAPYPNDSAANRKKNRTVTVLVTPGR
jgi:flagellar motor protein MotB